MSTAANGGGDDPVSFDPDAIRRRLPNGLTGPQERAMICAVRNPDAALQQVADAAGVNYSVVHGGLESLTRGILGDHGGSKEWYDRRGGENRKPESYQELTDKQQIVIDYLARHPSFDYRRHTSKQLDGAIRSHYDDPPAMSTAYAKQVAKEHSHLVDGRRDQLLAMGEDLDDDPDDPNDYEGFDPDTPREYLAAAGVDELPEDNLDGLDTGDAFTRASALDDEDPTRGTILDVAGEDFENHLDESRRTFDDADVTIGTGYLGVVNGISDWGVWVTIGGDPDDPNDVSGVLPEEKLEAAGRARSDYSRGDNVRVVATGRNENRGKVHHRFDIPTVDRLPRTSDESDEDTPETPEDPPSDAGTDGASDRTDTDQTTLTAVTGAQDGYVLTPDSEAGEAVEAFVDRLNAVERDLERVAEQAEENGEALPDPETAKELNEAAETVLEGEGQLDALADRVDTVENRTLGQNESLEDIRETLAAYEDRLDYLDAMENDVDHMGEVLADAVERVEDVEDRLDTLESALGRVDERTADLADRVDAIADRADGAHERITDALGTAPRDTTVVDAIETLEAAGFSYQLTRDNSDPITETDTETQDNE